MEIDFNELHLSNKDIKYNLPENLIFIKEIDQGAFAKVIHVKERMTNKDFALKIINKSESNLDLINRMKEEIQILKKLSHENIVKYYGHLENSTQLFIKMEYLKYGNLETWMKKNKNISEEDASIIIKQVLSAIAYLHQNQICHKDLKPENIMFSRENDISSIKIIDFGLSLQNFDSLCLSDYSGTLIYMAPEEIERKSYYLSVDIWSIGILMYMLLNKGEHPFYKEKDNKESFLKNLKENKPLKFDNKISLMAKHLIKKLLEYDPIKRYKASDALKHPWITRNSEDKIPLSFNEQLNNYNTINNAKKLMMISIFLNYFKKNNIYNKSKIKTNQEESTDNVNNKHNIYKINDEYVKKCEFFSKVKRDKLKELRGKYLYVKKDIESSEEKINNNLDINTNSNSNNTISNSTSSNSNNQIIKHCSTTKYINSNNHEKKSKLILHVSKKKKDYPLLLIDPVNSSIKKIRRKSCFSETKKNNIIHNYNKISKKSSIETEAINKNLLTESKKRKIFLANSSTKFFRLSHYKNHNNMNINEIDANAINYINQNINNIKPINLFLNNNNIAKLQSKKIRSRTNIEHIQLEKIMNENVKCNKHKNSVCDVKLPNISDKNTNMYILRKAKKNINL